MFDQVNKILQRAFESFFITKISKRLYTAEENRWRIDEERRIDVLLVKPTNYGSNSFT